MRRIKKYQQGGMSNFIDNINKNAGAILGGAADLFQQYQQINNAEYSTKSSANKATAMNVMKGAATGASVGSMFGPVGTAVGAVVGSIPGIVGNKSSVAKNGYYADPDMQYGTGILGSKTRRAAKREYDERMREVAGNRASAVTGAYNQALWNSGFDAENQLFAANGGNISDLAWVDDGEVLMTPDESIYKVPERHQPEDNNLVSIPEGTKILSDKLKVPGTKETFASMAKKLQSKKSKYNDKYSQGSAEANAINDKIVFDTLFDMQESMKNGKKEYKKGIQEFQGGGTSGDEYELGDRTGNYGLDLLLAFGDLIKGDMPRADLSKPYKQPPIQIDLGKINTTPRSNVSQKSTDTPDKLSDTTNRSRMDRYLLDKAEGKRTSVFDIPRASLTEPYPGLSFGERGEHDFDRIFNMPRADVTRRDVEKSIPSSNAPTQISPTKGFTSGDNLNNWGFSYSNPLWTSSERDRYSQYVDNGGGYVSDSAGQVYTPRYDYGRNLDFDTSALDRYNYLFELPAAAFATRAAGSTSRRGGGSAGPGGTSKAKAVEPEKLVMKDVELKPASVAVPQSELPTSLPYVPVTYNAPSTRNLPNVDWLSLATDITSMFPVLSNLNAKPEVFQPIFNPYASAALDLLGSRRYDVTPTLNAIRKGTASNNYAVSQYNTNTGANLAYRLQNAIKANNAIAGAYADAAIQNNQYAADYANALNSFGQQRVQAMNTAIDQNARSRAQARNIRRAGLSQLSNYMQNKLLMHNQREADAAMLDIYEPLLNAAFTPETYSKLFQQLRGSR